MVDVIGRIAVEHLRRRNGRHPVARSRLRQRESPAVRVIEPHSRDRPAGLRFEDDVGGTVGAHGHRVEFVPDDRLRLRGGGEEKREECQDAGHGS